MTNRQRDRKRHPERYCPACKNLLDVTVRNRDGQRIEERTCGWYNCPRNGRGPEPESAGGASPARPERREG